MATSDNRTFAVRFAHPNAFNTSQIRNTLSELTKGNSMQIEIKVPHVMITSKSVAWGRQNPELFKASQEAIRYAVQNSPQVNQLKEWLESRTKLRLSVEFHLGKQRIHQADLDSLLSDLLNPLVEGACGPRETGKPIPQTKDALFWQAEIVKIQDNDEKINIKIEPFQI